MNVTELRDALNDLIEKHPQWGEFPATITRWDKRGDQEITEINIKLGANVVAFDCASEPAGVSR